MNTAGEVAVTAQDILRHPRFVDAKQMHLRSVTALFLDDSATRRLMLDAGTITLRALLVGFYASGLENQGTVRRIQDLIVERGLASRRKLDHLIGRFRQVGYVDCVPSPADRRMRLLRPTAALIRHDRAHLRAYHDFLHVLYPDRGYDWDDEETHLAIRRTAFTRLDKAMAFMRHDSLRTLLSRDAGYLAFLLAADAQLRNEDDKSSFSYLAGRLGVSRSHVRNLFVEAERMGLVEIGGARKRAVRILPTLWDAYDRFLADIHAAQDAIAQIAFRALKQGQKSEAEPRPALD